MIKIGIARPILLTLGAIVLSACGGGGSSGSSAASAAALAAVLAASQVPAPAPAPSTPPASGPAVPPPPNAKDTCAKLNGASAGGATSLATSLVPATATAPTYCKVSGVLLPKLNFEIRVPDSWNSKLYYQGGGGFDGSVPGLNALSIQALSSGYIGVFSDSGHQAGTLDATWALNDPYAAELWGSLSVPTVMSTAVEVIKLAYGQVPTKSYYEGSSNGGREGMMAMRRNPNLFDGVIVRSPAYNIVGFFGHWNSNNKALSAPGATLSNAKVATLAKAVRDRCDALDGIQDGIVSNQAACNIAFDIASLRCANGADTGDSCLSDAQLAAVATVTSPASFGSGQTTFRDAARPLTGNEDDPGAWPAWITGNGNVRTTISFALTDSAIKSFVARDLSVDSLTYTPYDQDLNSLYAFSTLSDATSPDLRPFINSGGKVIFWHGGNDAAFPIQSTADYYEGVVNVLGGKPLADSSVRFYTAPGVNHTTGGPGADTSDLLAAIDAWVVEGRAPGNLLASKLNANGSIDFQRPLCQYPQYPRYTGPANDAQAAKAAASYVCASP